MRKLLIDADVYAYQAASACEVATDWGDGYWTWHCDINEVKATFLRSIEELMDTFGADDKVLCLTDSEGNFRKKILPTYKGNRSNIKKPLVLKEIRNWLVEEHGAYLKPHLEGDDCLGILATMKTREERIIVSIDKDMKTIPALVSRGDPADLRQIEPDEADYWHMYQTLTGDTTDGYSGCPGIGPKKAEALLDKDHLWKTFGTSYEDEPWPRLRWECVVAAYESKGLTEADALVQARVARILRSSDYDFKNKEPILWTPRAK